MKQSCFYILILCLLIVGCTDKGKQDNSPTEDAKAKELFQGLWVSDDNGEPTLLAKGDSVFLSRFCQYACAFFGFIKIHFYLKGQNQNEYKITKQSENLFVFLNDNGDEVRMVKSKEKDLRASFGYQVYAMNTFLHTQSDTIVRTDLGYFETKISVNTTSDRVIKSTYNENGIEVDNAYLDKCCLACNIKPRHTYIYT